MPASARASALRLDHAGLGRRGRDRLHGPPHVHDPVPIHGHAPYLKLGSHRNIRGAFGDQLRRALELGRIDADGVVASGHAAAYRAMKFVPTRFLSVGEWTLRPWRGDCGVRYLPAPASSLGQSAGTCRSSCGSSAQARVNRRGLSGPYGKSAARLATVSDDDVGAAGVRNCAANMMLLRGSKVVGTTWQLQWIVANARPWLAAILTAVSAPATCLQNAGDQLLGWASLYH